MGTISYKIRPENVNETNDGWGVHLIEVWFTLSSHSVPEDGDILLCASCVSETEINSNADYLIEQINKARRAALNNMSHMKDKFGKKNE